VSPDEVRQLADEIVGRAEYRRPEPSLLERGRDAVEDLIGEILEEAFSGSAGSLVGWLVLLAAVVAIVVFATRASRSVQVGRRVGIHVEGVHRRTPAEWRAEADALEAAGDWKHGLRCRYRALVGDLVAAGVLEDVAGRTTGEFRRDVADRAPERSTPFGEATELFELAWYADRPTGPEQSARFQALAADVVGTRV
jgi:hypothetical protein